MCYYKARIYSPTLGRFLQTDPIGYADGLNWYNYVGSDPVNATDPSGLCGRWGRYLDENGVEQSEWIVLKCPGEGGGGGGGYFLGLFRSGPVDDSGTLFGGGGAGAPQRVTVDKSCSGVAAAYDPRVQARALNALKIAIASDYEQGFFASQNIFSNGYSTGPIFSSKRRLEIKGDTIRRNKPLLIESLANGTYGPGLLVHTHQHFRHPSPVSKPDQIAADYFGFTVAAIDKSGRFTCTVN